MSPRAPALGLALVLPLLALGGCAPGPDNSGPVRAVAGETFVAWQLAQLTAMDSAPDGVR